MSPGSCQRDVCRQRAVSCACRWLHTRSAIRMRFSTTSASLQVCCGVARVCVVCSVRAGNRPEDGWPPPSAPSAWRQPQPPGPHLEGGPLPSIAAAAAGSAAFARPPPPHAACAARGCRCSLPLGCPLFPAVVGLLEGIGASPPVTPPFQNPIANAGRTPPGVCWPTRPLPCRRAAYQGTALGRDSGFGTGCAPRDRLGGSAKG